MSRPELARVPPQPLREYISAEQVEHDALAERLGIERSTLRQMLYRRDRLSVDQAQRVCVVLGVAPSTLWADWNDLVEAFEFEEQPWRRRARCRGDDNNGLFFGPAGERPEAAQAREFFAIEEYCRQCPVIEDCREFARRTRQYGVWGGETELERTLAGYPPRLPVGSVALAASFVRTGDQ